MSSYPHNITCPLTADYAWLDADYQSYLRICEEEDPELEPHDFRTWLTVQPRRYLLAHGIIVNA